MNSIQLEWNLIQCASTLTMKTYLLAIVAVYIYHTNSYASALEPQDLLITVFSQTESYHAAQAYRLRDNLLEQAEALEKEPTKIVLAHELNISGAWTVGLLLPHLIHKYPHVTWYLFCEEHTVIRLNLLLELLKSYNSAQEFWIGHALYDREPTIIHHFAEHTKRFKYPNIASGFAMTAPLVNSLAEAVSQGRGLEGDFSIDAAYEFASFVRDVSNVKRMTHAPELCVVSRPDCATYPRLFSPCDKPVSIEKVFVAVKTCSKFHTERVPIMLKTWARHASNIRFFSDKADENLPNAHVVPNTERGHCAKTLAILKHSDSILQTGKFDWLIISDDDTILSLGRLLRLLTCYNPANAVALGERYGFRVWQKRNGYDYLTGGAGLALSASLVHRLIQPGVCSCPSPSTPDDMFIFGVCLARIGVQPTHSPLFHQARPADYATAYLASQEPVSFHKFWMVDPESVYEEWFAEADNSISRTIQHTEL